MFSAIYGDYDRMNRLMSLGRDRAWRRDALMETGVEGDGRILDVATGSGDVLMEAACQFPQVQGVGVDFTPEMVVRATERLQSAKLTDRFSAMIGDALELPFGEASFDAALSAFMMRNVTDVRRAFAEQARVVRPGGRVVCLELTWPRRQPFRWLFGWYFARLVPIVGGILSGSREAYRYLPESVERFYTPAEVQEQMELAGLVDVRYRRLMLGTVTIHTGVSR
jgi:demethylmenaquinone methyltransferase/2-methoxy-6-polyprenyl-1,4-benzoquinol methylase